MRCCGTLAGCLSTTRAADMATCETCGAVYPTNGLRGAIHEPSACRDVLAVRVAELTRERDEVRLLLIDSVPTDLVVGAEVRCPSCGDGLVARLGTELKAALVAERAAHALTRARLEAAERVVEATQRVLVQPEHWEERVRQALATIVTWTR